MYIYYNYVKQIRKTKLCFNFKLLKYLPEYHLVYSIVEASHLKFAYLYIQWEGRERHRTNESYACGNGVHNFVVFIQP